MGLITRIFGGSNAGSVSRAVTDIAEVFTPNATRRMELGHDAFVASVKQHGVEFEHGGNFLFDRIINGLNRLPRPMLALGTLGLFIYAMTDPVGFSTRMEGLAFVPDPLWWLLGAIVSFYFGARELHYRRDRPIAPRVVAVNKTKTRTEVSNNSALDDWRAQEAD